MKDQTCNQTCNQFATEYITKQAAIDALRVAYWDDNIQSAKDDPCIVDAMTDWAIRQVKALPPAQPESLVNESRPLVKDTISRQAAIDALDKLSESTYEVNYGVVDCDDAINAIAALPPTEPKKGKWIKVGRWGRVYKCNRCGNLLDFDGVNAGRGSTNFCPNCGADMREGE